MVDAAEDLLVRAEIKAGDVEEEVGGPLVVAVPEEVGERELQDALVET